MSVALLKKLHYKVLLNTYLLSLIIYPLLFYTGLTGIKKLTNLLLVSIIVLVSIPICFSYIQKYKTKKLYVLAIFLVMYLLIVSILRNRPDEYIPTFLRYTSYLIVFGIGYINTKLHRLNRIEITKLLSIGFYIALFFGILEIATGNLAYFNSSFRATGNFSEHSTGYSLFLFVLLIYFINEYRLTKKFYFVLLVIGSFILLYLSQSRTLIILSILVYPLSKFILYEKLSYKIYTFVGIIILFISLYFVIPMFLSDTRLFTIYQILFDGKVDGSTQTRIFIITESLSHLTTIDEIIGIGLGGFNDYFYSITGRLGVAAHNIYLQLYVEGGWIGLLLFVFLQLGVVKKMKSSYRNKNHKQKYLLEMGLALFLGIEILGFLLNAHYYYQSQLLFMLILGFIISVTD